MPAVLPLEGTGAPQSEVFTAPSFGNRLKAGDVQVIAATYFI